MAGDRIHHGDYVIIYRRFISVTEKIVLVRTPVGLVLKRVFPVDEDTIRLVSSNPEVKDQIFPIEEIKIIGIAKRMERDL